MQGVRQIVLYLTRDTLPMLWITQPAGAIGNKSPGPDLGDPCRKRIKTAVGAVLGSDMAGEPVLRDMTGAHDKAKHGYHEFAMRRRRQFAIIRNLAAFPEAGDIGSGLCRSQHFFIACGEFERDLILGKQGPRKALHLRQAVERGGKCGNGGEIEFRISPLQHVQRIEVMLLQLFDKGFVESRATARRAECSVPEMAAGAAGYLTEFGGC